MTVTIPTLGATNGEKYDPAMKVTTREEAADYLAACVEHTMRACPEMPYEQALATEKSNIGYWAGYYDDETRRRVEELYDCEHPIFGSIAKNGRPTMEAALKAGIERGKALRDD